MSSDRYIRLARLEEIGEENLKKLQKSRIALIGCGTLGGNYALNLVRLGITYLRLIDRDIVEEHNLSTQALFDEEDVKHTHLKVTIAKRKLQKIASTCEIEAHPADLTYRNAERLLANVDIILDATDNFDTRFLINDTSVKLKIPWIYTGIVGYNGTVMAILPGESACLRCLMDSPPEAGTAPTCETNGVWAPVAQATVALGLTELLQIVLGKKPKFGLSQVDFLMGNWTRISVSRKKDCPVCLSHEFEYLQGHKGVSASQLCGREMVHLSSDREETLNLSEIAQRYRSSYQVTASEELLHLIVPEGEIYLFQDGRALVKGISDPARARSLYNRYISA